MMDFIIVPTVVGIICASIYGLFELVIRRKERILMIEKMCERMDPIQMDGKISFNPFRKRDRTRSPFWTPRRKIRSKLFASV